MGNHILLQKMLQFAIAETVPGSARADAILSWCKNHKKLPGFKGLTAAPKKQSDKPKKKQKKTTAQKAAWDALRDRIGKPLDVNDAEVPAPMITAGRLCDLLGLDVKETRLLQAVVAFHRVPPIASLCRTLTGTGIDMVTLAAESAGYVPADQIAQSAVARFGLVELSANYGGDRSIDTAEPLDRVLDRSPVGNDRLIECLVGKQVKANLTLADFAEQSDAVMLIKRMLAGALTKNAAGVNILLYGPPGTGKTELAMALAGAVGARMTAVGEVDDYGDEPSRWARLTALKLAQQVLAGRTDMLLLFDELEDLIGEVEQSAFGGFISRREGSKVFINRLFETNPVPTIWTSNAIENVDPAYLRRMSFVLKMDIPQLAARTRIIGRIARDEGMDLSEETALHFADTAPEATTVARNAIRTAQLAGGGAEDAEEIMEALVTGIRHGRRVPPNAAGGKELDLDLYEAHQSIAGLFDRITAPGAPADFSLLLTGPPGTGKTALAHHLAKALNRPLLIKRASDILSKWVGETEQQIADAFAEARDSEAVLLLDEIDSLLFDRGTASHTWEVSQVNEFLTWMESHPMPFVAATNYGAKLDAAAMRRFVFKIDLEALPAEKAERAFQRFFDAAPPRRLKEIGGLTPGDFAVVVRQLRFGEERPSPDRIVDLLEAEVRAKPGTPGRIGFRG